MWPFMSLPALLNIRLLNSSARKEFRKLEEHMEGFDTDSAIKQLLMKHINKVDPYETGSKSQIKMTFFRFLNHNRSKRHEHA